MVEDDNVKELSLRIERLEKMLESGGVGRTSRAAAANLTQDEIKAFEKVRDVVVGDWGCGINECSRCIIVRCLCEPPVWGPPVWGPCDIECSCGPCNVGGLRGRLGRFGGMG